MNFFVGIDIGTSSAKLLLIDERGKLHREAREEYDYVSPQSGWTEIEPAVWMEAVEKGMDRLLQEFPHRAAIAGIGTTGQMHTTVFLDAEGNSIRPAIMWNDTRTLSLLAEVKENVERISKISHVAKIISAGSPAMNLYWLKTEEPENFARLKKFLIGPDYIVYRLTGIQGTDYCEASTSSLYDFEGKTWSQDMQKLLGFSNEIYPAIRGSAIPVGTLNHAWATRWGLPGNVRVVAGTGDNPATAYANGVSSGNNAVLSLGTSGVLVVARDVPAFERCGKNIAFSLDGEKIHYLVQGVVQSAGRAMNWWMLRILKNRDFNADLANVDMEALGESDLIFYPHIMGEKTLYNDMDLRGAFLGLSDETARADMQVAIMEGIAFGVKELAEAMAIPREKLDPLRVTGGGANNRIWLQILADVLEMPVKQLAGEASAVYGAARLAGKAADAEWEEGDGGWGDVLRPRLKNAVAYRKKYRRYKKIHDAMKGIYSD